VAAQEGGQSVGGLSSCMLYFPPQAGQPQPDGRVWMAVRVVNMTHVAAWEGGHSVEGFQCKYRVIFIFFI
jgi:hypothetical protein